MMPYLLTMLQLTKPRIEATKHADTILKVYKSFNFLFNTFNYLINKILILIYKCMINGTWTKIFWNNTAISFMHS